MFPLLKAVAADVREAFAQTDLPKRLEKMMQKRASPKVIEALQQCITELRKLVSLRR
jgi:hypothetical protein